MSSLGNIPADIRVPLVYIDIDNSQALDSAPAQSRKIIVIGQQSATGTAAVLTQNRITSDGTADQLYGKGSMLAGMLKTLRKANSYTEVWAMGLADIAAGAAAKSDLTISGPATAAGTLALLVNGISVQVGVSVVVDQAYDTASVLDLVRTSLQASLSVDVRTIAQPLTTGDIILATHAVPGVVAVTIAAPADGVVEELLYAPGDQVMDGDELLRLGTPAA